MGCSNALFHRVGRRLGQPDSSAEALSGGFVFDAGRRNADDPGRGRVSDSWGAVYSTIRQHSLGPAAKLGRSQCPRPWTRTRLKRVGSKSSGRLRVRPAGRRARRCRGLQPQVREDLLDDRLFQHRRNDLQLATAVRAVLHRQDVHGFTARPLELDDPEAAAAEYPLLAEMEWTPPFHRREPSAGRAVWWGSCARVATRQPPLAERRPRDAYHDVRARCSQASVPDVLGRRRVRRHDKLTP